MNVALKLTGFLVALAAVFGVSYLTGTQSQLLLAPPPELASAGHAAPFSGLASSLDGYTLTLNPAAIRAGNQVPLGLTISGPDGSPVTSYDTVDDARIHLIAVRRDLAGYQHLYPALSGVAWTVRLDLTPSPWHIVVDGQPTGLGRELTLAADLTVPGPYRPTPVIERADAVQVDGYTLTRAGELATSTDSALAFLVTRDGRPVTDLDTFHGSTGHAVLLRPADFGFLHLHPYLHASSHRLEIGPELRFSGAVPERGRYRVFVEFRTGGEPHVALFTLAVTR